MLLSTSLGLPQEAHRIALLSQQASGEERRTSTQPPDELTYGQDIQYPQAPQVQPGRRRSRRRHVDVPIPTHTLCDPVPPPLSLSIALQFRQLWMMQDRLNVHHPVIIRMAQTFTQMQALPNMLRNARLRPGDQHRL